jgi:hypothetical protein
MVRRRLVTWAARRLPPYERAKLITDLLEDLAALDELTRPSGGSPTSQATQVPARRRGHLFISYRYAKTPSSWVQEIARAIMARQIPTKLDPLESGDRTGDGLAAKLLESSHFLQLVTPDAVKLEHLSCRTVDLPPGWSEGRWYSLEAIFADYLALNGAMAFVPLRIDGAALAPPGIEYIHMSCTSADAPIEIADRIAAWYSSTGAQRRLSLDTAEAARFVDRGREHERDHATIDPDERRLHAAIREYDQAIAHHLSNHKAWGNKAWSLWKLRPEPVAWQVLNVGRLIRPDSQHLAQIARAMAEGRRTLAR